MIKVLINAEFDEPVIEEWEISHLNGFGGADTEKQQVLQSAAGYYIGSLYYDKDMNGFFPYDRDSANYWKTRKEAEHALTTGDYMPKF